MIYNICIKGDCNYVYIAFLLFYLKGEINIPRLARKNINTSFLHVMVQGVNKEYIFNKEKYIKKYLKTIECYKSEYNFNILAYCIMNNHAHFLIYTENIIEFGNFMHKVNMKYAQFYNKEEKRCGVLFRNRYKIEPINDMKYLINCIIYIHNNPVKAKIVKKCEDYKYSSYNDFKKNKGLAQTKILRNIFGTNCNFLELFNKVCERRFMDIEEDMDSLNFYIAEGILEFKKTYFISLAEIMSNRKILRDLVFFLNENYGFTYVEIGKFFGFSRGTLQALRR